MKTESGAVFDSESIDYLASRSLFITNEPVMFQQQRMTLTARGMELDVKQQTVRFNKAVDANVEGLLRR